MDHKAREPNGPDPFNPARRKPITLSQADLIKADCPEETGERLLWIRPNTENVNLAAWANNHGSLIAAGLSKHGAILFRDFNLATAADFEGFVKATSGGPLEYNERSSPRSQVTGNIYTSTDYPPEHNIFLHNEQSYNTYFPLRIYFFCMTPPRQGGETPIADCRRVFNRIDRAIVRRFVERKYLYVRNFGDGFGLTWQDAFQTRDRRAVEQYCRINNIEFEWKANDRLKTRQLRQAVGRHPGTGEVVWFNHLIFFHVTTLESPIRELLLEEFNEEDLPNNTYYGDGSAIEDSVLDELRRAYVSEMISFPWQAGDLLMLDNMLTAHGRRSFVPPRKVIVGMADPFNWTDVRPL